MDKTARAFLRDLIESISPSGYEAEAAVVWEAYARGFADEVRRDVHGSTHAVVNPGGSPRIMLAGHIDEIGFMVTHIDKEGYLWIQPVGGWDAQIPQGQRVTLRGRKGHVRGVIGKGPIHLMPPDARNKVTGLDKLWVDIGAKDQKDAEKRVAVGDPLVLGYGYEELPRDLAVGRGFDNRAGAFVVLEAARRAQALSPKAEIHAVATAQEEIGLRGATTSTFAIEPQVGIAVDVTFATDHPAMGDAVKRENMIKLGQGPVLTRGPNINGRVFDLLRATAKAKKIGVQINAEPRGTGTDANVMQLSRAGVATALVGIPNRYMHSPCEMVSLKDLDRAAALLAHTAAAFGPETDLVPF